MPARENAAADRSTSRNVRTHETQTSSFLNQSGRCVGSKSLTSYRSGPQTTTENSGSAE